MSDSPLTEQLQAYAALNTFRFHMPGHKGAMDEPFASLAVIDFTELGGTGNLYTEEDGFLRRAEEKLAALFNADGALMLTGGATQGVMSMLAAVARPGDGVIVDRACHKSVFHTMALLDLRPVYIQRQIIAPFGIPAPLVLPQTAGNAVCAVITSPTYYGVLSNDGVFPQDLPLLTDAAHGAHLAFMKLLPKSGIAVFSAHKTLPALGQAAFLLVNSGVDTEKLRYFTSVFGTSSPSYPIMASIDSARERLEKTGEEGWTRIFACAEDLRERFPALLNGKSIPGIRLDPARLCLYTGSGYRDALRCEREFKVYPEMADENNIVFILTPNDSEESLSALEKAISAVSPETMPESVLLPAAPLPEMVLTPREALFAPERKVKLIHAAGETAARAISLYPPGIPLVAPGERIEREHIEGLLRQSYAEEYVYICR